MREPVDSSSVVALPTSFALVPLPSRSFEPVAIVPAQIRTVDVFSP